MERLSKENEPEKIVVNKKIAIVNPWDNKFNNLYVKYFQNNNEVRLMNPQSERAIIQVHKWADLVWSLWSNQLLAAFSKQSFNSTLVTYIHSYEILTPQLMQSVEWKRVNGIIFVSDHIRQNSNRLWSQTIKDIPQTTVYNSVDLSEYPFRHVRPGKNIGYIGYINHKKGIGLLLQCIKAVVDFDPEFKFHIAGSFQETRFEVYMSHMIEQMGLKDNIVFHNWVSNIPDWLKSINYVISTSPWEGCPYNLIEAMASGVKPLIHNWQGAKTLFPEKFVFNTIDELISLIKDPVYDSENIRMYAEKKFNAALNIPKIERFLADCINNNTKTLNNICSKPVQTLKSSNTTVGPPRFDNDNTRSAEGVNEKPGINFFQPLAQTIELSSNRKDFTVEFCRGKRVLHIGCIDAGIMDQRIQGNNFLHYQIGGVSSKLIGADIEPQGLKRLSEEGYEVYKLNLETDIELLQELSRQVDVIVIPEVIEHLNNVGKALDNIKSCAFAGDILISTPNAFSFRAYKMLGKCIELIHPDHNYYFSPTTLKTLLSKHRFGIERLIMYYWPTNDTIGKELHQIVTACPYYAEGIIAIVKDLPERSH